MVHTTRTTRTTTTTDAAIATAITTDDATDDATVSDIYGVGIAPDDTTGDPIDITTDDATDAVPFDDVVTAYRSGDRSAKSRIAADINRSIRSANRVRDYAMADRLTATYDACMARVSVAPSVDVADVLARRVASLLFAADAIATGASTPSGITRGDVTYAAIATAVERITRESVATATDAIATERVTRSERHAIVDAIARAFADVPSGTAYTMRQIARRGAIDGYAPSDGAIAARIFPESGRKMTVVGIVPVPATADHDRMARKI